MNHTPALFALIDGGRWYPRDGRFYHTNSAGVVDFVDDADGDAEGEWITIGGVAGPKGQMHAGGFPVKVKGGTPGPDGKKRGGTIIAGKLAGKLGLHGKATTDVPDHLEKVREHVDKGKTVVQAVKAVKAEKVATEEKQAAAVASPKGAAAVREKLFSLSREADKAWEHYSHKPQGFATSVYDPMNAEMHLLQGKVFSMIGAGEDPKAVLTKLMEEARKSAAAYNAAEKRNKPLKELNGQANSGSAGFMSPDAAAEKIQWAVDQAVGYLREAGLTRLPKATSEFAVNESDGVPGVGKFPIKKEKAVKAGFLFHGMTESGFKELLGSDGFEGGGFSKDPQPLYGPRYVAIDTKQLPKPSFSQGNGANVQYSFDEPHPNLKALRSPEEAAKWGAAFAFPLDRMYEADKDGNIIGRLPVKKTGSAPAAFAMHYGKRKGKYWLNDGDEDIKENRKYGAAGEKAERAAAGNRPTAEAASPFASPAPTSAPADPQSTNPFAPPAASGADDFPMPAEYRDVPDAGRNTQKYGPANEYNRNLVGRLNTYEREYMRAVADPKMADLAHAHAMTVSGLTDMGLGQARGLVGKFVSRRPGIVMPTTRRPLTIYGEYIADTSAYPPEAADLARDIGTMPNDRPPLKGYGEFWRSMRDTSGGVSPERDYEAGKRALLELGADPAEEKAGTFRVPFITGGGVSASWDKPAGQWRFAVEDPKPSANRDSLTDPPFQADLAAVPVPRLTDAALLKQLKQSSGRFNFLSTLRESGVATDGRYLVVVPENALAKMRAAIPKETEGLRPALTANRIVSPCSV